MADDWACPCCGGSLTFVSGASIACTGCSVVSDAESGIPDLTGGEPGSRLDRAAYRRFLIARARLRQRDAYAAFQPFNESARTWRAFLPLLRKLLQPGDRILDLHNRTGWTGAELAAEFPSHRVLSLWEGDRDLLGRRGYRYWFGDGQAPANLSFAFTDPGLPIPVADQSVTLVHGYDVLHHRDPERLAAEVKRVLRPGGCALFPHVHTADGVPAPWFERGGVIRRAADIAKALTEGSAGSGLVAIVMGEAGLFRAMGGQGARLRSGQAGDDYNAFVALVPQAWMDAALAIEPDPVWNPHARIFINPLVAVDAVDGSIGLCDGDGMLQRHPVYAERLRERLPGRLDNEERLVHYWCNLLPDAGRVARRLQFSPEHLHGILTRLQRAEVLAIRLLDEATTALQRCHATARHWPTVDADHPRQLWAEAQECYANRPWLIAADGGVLSYVDAGAIIRALARTMARHGIGPGSTVVISAAIGIESMVLLWAAAIRDALVAVIEPGAGIPEGLPSAVLVFADRPQSAPSARIRLASESAGQPPQGWQALATWYDDADLADGAMPMAHGHDASPRGLILCTSGSTGRPKGVHLSWPAVARSARSVAHHFRWSEDDRLLSLAALHTMSGVRNPCFAIVACGGSAILPQTGEPGITLIDQATILAAAPASLRQLSMLAQRPDRPAMSRLRQVLCTASHLPPAVRQAFQSSVGLPVIDYYGLTETCGFCISEDLGSAGQSGIGRPVDAMARIDPISGELHIHSSNLLIGYVGEAARPLHAHWYATGDLARVGPAGGIELDGRMRDIVKNAHGEIVSCREVEAALQKQPGVSDAAVRPGHDQAGMECLDAWVVVVGGAAGVPELSRHLLAHIGPRRMPARLIAVEGIRRGSTGKILADALTIPEQGRDHVW